MSSSIDEDRNHSRLISELARKYGMKYSDVKEIVTHQQRFTVETMRTDSRDGVKWPYLGKFVFSKSRYNRYLKKIEKINGSNRNK